MSQGTKNEMEGKFHEVKGKVKEKVGRVTNDPDLDEDTAEKVGGEIQKRVGQIERLSRSHKSLPKRMSRRSDLGSLQNVVEAADSEPAIPVRLKQESMFAGVVGGAVVSGKQVHQAFRVFDSDGERHFARDCR